MRKRRLNHETDTGLFADVSFLLLIFFMMVTTFHKTYRLDMRLPPLPENTRSGNMPKDRILKIYLNGDSALLIDEEVVPLDAGLDMSAALDKITRHGTKGIVSISMMPTSKYADYILLIDGLKRSKKTLMNQKAKAIYDADFHSLKADQQAAIRDQIKFSISEKEIQ